MSGLEFFGPLESILIVVVGKVSILFFFLTRFNIVQVFGGIAPQLYRSDLCLGVRALPEKFVHRLQTAKTGFSNLFGGILSQLSKRSEVYFSLLLFNLLNFVEVPDVHFPLRAVGFVGCSKERTLFRVQVCLEVKELEDCVPTVVRAPALVVDFGHEEKIFPAHISNFQLLSQRASYKSIQSFHLLTACSLYQLTDFMHGPDRYKRSLSSSHHKFQPQYTPVKPPLASIRQTSAMSKANLLRESSGRKEGTQRRTAEREEKENLKSSVRQQSELTRVENEVMRKQVQRHKLEIINLQQKNKSLESQVLSYKTRNDFLQQLSQRKPFLRKDQELQALRTELEKEQLVNQLQAQEIRQFQEQIGLIRKMAGLGGKVQKQVQTQSVQNNFILKIKEQVNSQVVSNLEETVVQLRLKVLRLESQLKHRQA